MGQDIKFIITTEEVTVPIYIIHFKEKNATVFPMLVEDNDFQEISDYAKRSNENVSAFFDTILCSGYYLEYPTQRLLSFIKQSTLKTLAIIGYREIADLSQNIGDPILFVDDKIFDISSIVLEPNEYILENKILSIINSAISSTAIINNEEKYWSYESSEIFYLENLNKH